MSRRRTERLQRAGSAALFAGSMPTITALGVPQTAFFPLWLLRQTILIGWAEGAGAVAWLAAGAGARALEPGEGLQPQSAALASGATRETKVKRRMARRI